MEKLGFGVEGDWNLVWDLESGSYGARWEHRPGGQKCVSLGGQMARTDGAYGFWCK